jgi:hypothetical protein
VISGFRRGVNEIFSLLGCYAAQNDHYHLQQTSFTLEDGTDRKYQSTLRNIPEEQISSFYFLDAFISVIYFIFFFYGSTAPFRVPRPPHFEVS